MPTTRHTISGAIAVVPQNIIDHEVFGRYLEVVPEGTKPFTPGHFLQGTIEEREAVTKQAEADAAKSEDKDKK